MPSYQYISAVSILRQHRQFAAMQMTWGYRSISWLLFTAYVKIILPD